MWLFGYGGLIYHADFKYIQKVVGKIKGYSRRFFQISIYARGNLTIPGRVLTLVPNKYDCVWGVAYELSDKDATRLMQKMTNSSIDGYQGIQLKFFPKQETENIKLTRSQMLKRLNAAPKEKGKSPGEMRTSADTDADGGPFNHEVFIRPSHTAFTPVNWIKKDKTSEKQLFADQSLLDATRTRKSYEYKTKRFTKNAQEATTSRASGSTPKSTSFAPPSLTPSPRTSNTEERNIERMDSSKSPRSSLKNSDERKGSSRRRSKSDSKRGSKKDSIDQEEPIDLSAQGFDVYTFIGTSDNIFYSYEADDDIIASQIAHAKGLKGMYGTNADYVFSIADELRILIPKINDDYIFTIEQKLKNIMEGKTLDDFPKLNLSALVLRSVSKDLIESDIIEK